MSATPLWDSVEAAKATSGRLQGPVWAASGMSIDTRTLAKGDLFVALVGNNDGHAFVAKALELGAAAALVSRVPEGVAADAPLLLVGDTLRALEDLGRASRARTKAQIIAVTGSAGKTTTKEMLRVMLAGLGSVSASSASYNNHWGAPLSLARMPREAEYGVFEVGMNHAGEIRALVAMVRPDVVMITTVAPAHLEFFGTLEAIADAKAEIFEGLDPTGLAIVPADNPQSARLTERARAVGVKHIQYFGTAKTATARLISTAPDGEGQLVEAELGGQPLHFRIGADGIHIAMNAMAALLAVRAVGGDPADAGLALNGFNALGGRGARFVSPLGATVIDEGYNANPASMSAALQLLGRATPGKGGRRVVVLGDMLELGEGGVALHRGLAADVAAARADLVFLCGPQMKALWDDIGSNARGAHAPSSVELAPQVLAALQPGDVVLVKGSFGSRMAVIVNALKAGTFSAVSA